MLDITASNLRLVANRHWKNGPDNLSGLCCHYVAASMDRLKLEVGADPFPTIYCCQGGLPCDAVPWVSLVFWVWQGAVKQIREACFPVHSRQRVL